MVLENREKSSRKKEKNIPNIRLGKIKHVRQKNVLKLNSVLR